MVASLASVGYLLPVLSFLFVFILVFALLKKTGVIGDNEAVAIFISLILASFFVVNASLVDFVQLTSAWIAVFAVSILFILVLLAFVSKDALEAFTSNKAVAWIVVGLLVVFFIISSSYVFNWAVNWSLVNDWFYTDWFGFVLLIIVAAVVAKVITKN